MEYLWKISIFVTKAILAVKKQNPVGFFDLAKLLFCAYTFI
jgi:hypothetical protein